MHDHPLSNTERHSPFTIVILFFSLIILITIGIK